MPLTANQLYLRAVVSHGVTYTKMRKYQRRLLLAKTPTALAKAAAEYQKAFYELRESGVFQEEFVKLVNKFKL